MLKIIGIVKLGELQENPEEDNLQLSFDSNILESSETSDQFHNVEGNITTSAQHNENYEEIVRTACITNEDAELSDKEQIR